MATLLQRTLHLLRMGKAIANDNLKRGEIHASESRLLYVTAEHGLGAAHRRN